MSSTYGTKFTWCISMQGLNLAPAEVQIRWKRLRQGGGGPGKGLAAAGLPARKADMKVRLSQLLQHRSSCGCC